MRFLLDTNVCICFLRGRPQRLVARVRATRLDDLTISSVVVAELLHGALRSRDPARETALVEGFVGNLTVLPFDSLTAASYASVRRGLEVKSALIGAFDMLIAATALRPKPR
jgi:tRNA(fMet)-specific endonuclease VapC